MTPEQVILLSKKQEKELVIPPGEYPKYRAWWLAENSEEALLRKAEKKLQRELARRKA
jgi:hypothetical protein